MLVCNVCCNYVVYLYNQTRLPILARTLSEFFSWLNIYVLEERVMKPKVNMKKMLFFLLWLNESLCTDYEFVGTVSKTEGTVYKI